VSDPRPFRFGATCMTMSDRASWQDLARGLADSGYEILTVVDHVGSPGVWGSLVSAYDAAPGLRVGTLVLNNDLWNPAVLAREALTVDLLTDGHLELGIGAGWNAGDYDSTGVIRHTPGIRVERLAETLQVLDSALNGRPVSVHGEHYNVDSGDRAWRAGTAPHRIPLLVGGGSRRVLGLAAQYADIVSIHRNLEHGASAQSWSAEISDQGEFADPVAKKVAWIAQASGDRFETLILHTLILKLVVTTRRDDAIEDLARAQDLPAELVRSSPHFLVGTAEQVVDELTERRQRWGISYWTLAPGNDMAAFAPVVAALAGH
jgi:probable F420-dependent oxidoreductase